MKTQNGASATGTVLCDNLHVAERIGDKAYRIDEGGLSNSYLLIGSEAALLIDTSDGAGDLRQCVEQLTDRPVIVAVTHRHPDHVGGAWEFGTYYASKADDKPVYNRMCMQVMSDLMVRMCHVKITHRKPFLKKTEIIWMEDGKTFDLGDRVIRVRSIPGHTAGSVMFIDEQEKMIYTGDDVNPCLWMQLQGCIKLNDWITGAKEVLSYLEKGYTAWNGHSDGKQPIDQVQKTIELANELITMKKNGTLPKRKGIYPNADVIPNIFYNVKNI